MTRKLREMADIAMMGCHFEVHDARPVVWTCGTISAEVVNSTER